MYPYIKYAEVGKSVEFRCFSVTPPLWYYKFDINIKILIDVLVIKKVKLSNMGKYKCEGTNKDRNKFYSNGYLRVTSKETISFNCIFFNNINC